MALLGFPLYHGTSTLFLESIAKHGLGGRDPVKELRVVECALRLLPVAESLVKDSPYLEVNLPTFQRMAEQSKTGFNFQHGQTYLSPAISTVIRYAVNNVKGSEIISYTLKVIDELIRLGKGEVGKMLHREFPALLSLVKTHAAPVLLRLNNVDEVSLSSEKGECAASQLDFIRNTLVECPESGAKLFQQENFRLIHPLPTSKITAYLISVRRYHAITPDYCLLPITLDPLPAPTA